MKYQTSIQGEVMVVRLTDTLTFEDHETFNRLVREINASEAQTIQIDVAELEMVDSAGVGLILLANDQCKKGGKSLKVNNLRGHVAEVARLFKLDQLIDLT